MNVVIYSVNPNRVFLDRGPLGEYYAEPAKVKEPKRVEDLGRTVITDIVQNVYHGKRDFHGRPEFVPTTTSAISIAEDLVSRNREQRLRGTSGIFIPKGVVPTEEEIEDAKAQLRLACMHACDVAESQWNSGGRNRMTISDEARRAAAYLGIKPDWAGNAEGVKTCDYCAETIKAAAKICRFCNREVPGSGLTVERKKTALAA